MPREIMPVTLWRESLCFWMRMAQANAEFGLRMWQALGFPPPRPMDRAIEAVCEAAAKPAEAAEPPPLAAAPVPTRSASARKPVAGRPAARKPAVPPVPAE